jgi:glycosyltransferase involved in cell wall biosynthesis
MKIAIISHGRGGMLHYALDLVSILEDEFEVTLFTTEDLKDFVVSNKVNIVQEINLTKFNSARLILDTFLDFDAYHFTSFHPSLYSLLFKRKKRLENVFFTMHDCNVHPYNYSFIKRIKIKFIYNKFLMKIFLKKINCTVTLSAYVAGQANQKFNIDTFIIRLPNYSNKFRVIPKESDYFSKKGTTLLVFGSIEKYKGVDKIIDLLKYIEENDINDINFIIAGRVSEAYLESFQSFKNLSLHDRFILDSEVDTLFKQADYIIAPYEEVSQSGVLSLALDYHLPIIASDIGSFSEYIKPENGKLLKEMTPISILKIINEGVLKRSKNCKVDELEKEQQLEKYVALYSSVQK